MGRTQRRRTVDAPSKHFSALVTWVVVLGDFGRSPRMQYHCMSLASRTGSHVHVIAYGGATPLSLLLEASNVRIHTLPEPPKLLSRLPRVLHLLLKVLHQMVWLLCAMFLWLPRPTNILLQNPPAIPTMALCWLAAKWRRARLIIDWHNFGYTILALSQRSQHASLLVRLAERYERFWGAVRGAQHLCVTRAMQRELHHGWGIDAHVLHDRPPRFFQHAEVATVHELFGRLEHMMATARHRDWISPLLPMRPSASGTSSGPGSSAGAEPGVTATALPPALPRATTVLTTTLPMGSPQLRHDRPAVIVSSTSWTPDEDFSILLDAALLYDAMAVANADLPRLLLLITGRGPQKAMYEARLARLSLHSVAIRTLWLEPGDYPKLLGSADIGVSLHASSSGLDLPMKVVDMFGSGLPVCALNYSCIGELVQHGETGMLFSSSEQLSDCLAQLLRGFPANRSALLQRLRSQVATKQQGLRWEDNWDAVAWPLLRRQTVMTP